MEGFFFLFGCIAEGWLVLQLHVCEEDCILWQKKLLFFSFSHASALLPYAEVHSLSQILIITY